jgi:hypothetical protein
LHWQTGRGNDALSKGKIDVVGTDEEGYGKLALL